MRDLVLWHLFEHMMDVLNDNRFAKIGQKAMIFFYDDRNVKCSSTALLFLEIAHL